MWLCVEIGQCALWTTEMAFACVHRFVGIKRDRKYTGSPCECVATPEACGSRRIRRNLGASQDLLHHVATESFGRMGDFNCLQNVRVVRRRIRRRWNTLFGRQTKGKNDGCFRQMFLRGHLIVQRAIGESLSFERISAQVKNPALTARRIAGI
jgi:hypothetical protein